MIAALAMVFTFPCSAAVYLTSNVTHTYSYIPGGQFSLTGYLYYSDNTATSITCDKLGFSCKNTSTGDTDVTAAVFNAYHGGGAGNNNETTGDYHEFLYIPRIAPGELGVYTTPSWGGVTNCSPVYNKYGAAAIFEMGAGFSQYTCVMHDVWCYADRFSEVIPGAYSLSAPQNVVTFTELQNSSGNCAQTTAAYELSNVRATNDLFFIETKSAELLDTQSGVRYELSSCSANSNEMTYTIDTTEISAASDTLQVVAPVVYMEELATESVVIPLDGTSELLNVTIGRSTEKYPDAPEGVLVEFTALDVEHLPYNMALVSNGQIYDDCSVSYLFDFETGDFIRGELVFVGLTMDDLAENVILDASSMLNQYTPTEYSFNQ